MRRWGLSTLVAAVVCVMSPAAGHAAAVVAVPIQEPAGATHTEPAAVSCPTDDECLAVGSWLNGSYVRSGLVERWSGDRWQILSAAEPKGQAGRPVFLNDIACPAARACVVVGERANDSTNPPSASTPLSERWNRSDWRPISIAPVGHAMPELDAVSCASVANCMAVGSVGPEDSARAVAERYNGTRWRVSYLAPATARRSALDDVSCVDAMCLAIGTQRVTRNGLSASVLAWRAGGWRSVPLSSARMAALAGVSCADATECLITGFSLAPPTTAILRLFDGRSLSTIPVTNATALGSRISCATRSFCLLLGIAGSTPLSGGTPIADIWNGTVLSPAFTGHAGAPACRPSFCMLLGSSGGQATAYRYQAAPG